MVYQFKGKSLVYLSLGSNLGDRAQYIEKAKIKVSSHPNIQILKESIVLETKALDFTDQPDFLNQILVISTDLNPLHLLDFLQSIENELGRVRDIPKGPRTIDIDILSYDNLQMNHPRLQLPHHSIQTRPFIQELLNNIKK